MSKNSGKAPSIQFYYKDWLSDERLRLCSLEAKGLWMDIISQSVSMPVPGVFAIKNETVSESNLNHFEIISESKLLQMFAGKTVKKRNAFAELKKYGVIKQMDDGTFYVKRVKDDMRLRAIRKEAGKLGGNPQLMGGLVSDLVNQTANQTPTPSTSTSTSTPVSRLVGSVETLETNRPTDVLKFDKAPKQPPQIEEVIRFFSDQELDGNPAAFYEYNVDNEWQAGVDKWRNMARRWSRKEMQYMEKKG